MTLNDVMTADACYFGGSGASCNCRSTQQKVFLFVLYTSAYSIVDY